ncbi:MAG: YggS family pyridoxal phosphate-dependent enzyme [Planctomycetes bacterium]|nr:YggS family pyridoxal phosphate-dependent enzyme [Planctomycetota bacterium]
MSAVAGNFAAVRARIAAACAATGRAAEEVELLAVSKRHPAELVREAMATGQRAFGESRVQELVAKAAELRGVDGLRWHLIGSLQTNKVRDLLRVPGLELLHSCDRPKLADALQRELAETGAMLDVLLQVNASGEQQKHGCPVDDAAPFLAHLQAACPALRVRGLMAMGPLRGDARPVFERVVQLRDELRARSGLELATLSLGMSGDLDDAIAAGSTMVRVGTALFGARD